MPLEPFAIVLNPTDVMAGAMRQGQNPKPEARNKDQMLAREAFRSSTKKIRNELPFCSFRPVAPACRVVAAAKMGALA